MHRSLNRWIGSPIHLRCHGVEWDGILAGATKDTIELVDPQIAGQDVDARAILPIAGVEYVQVPREEFRR